MTGAAGPAGAPKEKPAGAWTAQETVLYMLDKTRPAVDALRVLWTAGDVAEGRPALSRWHPEYKPLFEEYMRENLANL
ncbi:hypothetical protein EW145_g8449 [Phellinidium pouzarii]|uniref:Uncharacterized protein n=1 Tax=Phellinidium pouzarii TaxID=167371 RepID=A0A4S4K607_9AGAM|nr:hypothetical protein EW145_g8449 [Phellinidium pouzarii]